jgi:hypothetical protein
VFGLDFELLNDICVVPADGLPPVSLLLGRQYNTSSGKNALQSQYQVWNPIQIEPVEVQAAIANGESNNIENTESTLETLEVMAQCSEPPQGGLAASWIRSGITGNKLYGCKEMWQRRTILGMKRNH